MIIDGTASSKVEHIDKEIVGLEGALADKEGSQVVQIIMIMSTH